MPLRAVWAAVPMLAPGATSSVAFSAQLSAGSPFGRLGLPSTPRALVCVWGGVSEARNINCGGHAYQAPGINIIRGDCTLSPYYCKLRVAPK